MIFSHRRMKFRMWQVAIFVLVIIHVTLQATKKAKTAVLTDIDDIKEFKKLLRTKTNILVLFVNEPKTAKPVSDAFKETADVMKGQATLVLVDCSSGDSKKLCKKLKVDPDKSHSVKHYKDGEFHKDYDRAETVHSMTNFLRDPTGDLPWEEDPSAKDIVHLRDTEALSKFLKGSGAFGKSMIMFYAPWCGFCKMMKPDYVAAAADLKGEAYLAAIDVAKPGNSKIRQHYNITGFPTLLYFEKGQLIGPYNGENKRKAIVSFIKDPEAQAPQKKAQDEGGSWSKDTDVVHLTGETFDSVLAKAENALVVFYAPWCGHCKRIKPEFEKAASRLKKEKINGILAAVDSTQEGDLSHRFSVKGYPTLKYFSRGVYKFDAGHARQEDQIVTFLKAPTEPPPPPPADKPWSEEATAVRHLNAATFRSALRKVKHALVMFYAPWCGHCKTTKPEFVKAAERFADELNVLFGAIDCTVEKDLCNDYGATGYPTIKYFSHFDKVRKEYNGGRKEMDFVSYIKDQMGQPLSQKTGQEAGFGASVVLATDDNFDAIISTKELTMVMFYATWCSHCVESKPAFSRLATKLKETGFAKAVAVEAAENPKVADFAGVQTLPTFKIFANGKILGVYEGDRSYDDMLKFVTSYKGKDEL